MQRQIDNQPRAQSIPRQRTAYQAPSIQFGPEPQNTNQTVNNRNRTLNDIQINRFYTNPMDQAPQLHQRQPALAQLRPQGLPPVQPAKGQVLTNAHPMPPQAGQALAAPFPAAVIQRDTEHRDRARSSIMSTGWDRSPQFRQLTNIRPEFIEAYFNAHGYYVVPGSVAHAFPEPFVRNASRRQSNTPQSARNHDPGTNQAGPAHPPATQQRAVNQPVTIHANAQQGNAIAQAMNAPPQYVFQVQGQQYGRVSSRVSSPAQSPASSQAQLPGSRRSSIAQGQAAALNVQPPQKKSRGSTQQQVAGPRPQDRIMPNSNAMTQSRVGIPRPAQRRVQRPAQQASRLPADLQLTGETYQRPQVIGGNLIGTGADRGMMTGIPGVPAVVKEEDRVSDDQMEEA